MPSKHVDSAAGLAAQIMRDILEFRGGVRGGGRRGEEGVGGHFTYVVKRS